MYPYLKTNKIILRTSFSRKVNAGLEFRSY